MNSSSFIINNEQNEPILNGIFTNKNGKIQCWPRNYDKFWEITNNLISLLNIFIYNWSIWKKIPAFGFWFWLLWKSWKLLSIFLRFHSIRSVKQISITNGKKTLFAVTYLIQSYLWWQIILNTSENNMILF